MDMLMNNLYGIYSMKNTYDQRAVANTERENFVLDTVMVTDRNWLYETAVAHKKFYNGNWIILEGCDTKERAQEKHNKWLEILERDDFDTLEDYYDHMVHNRVTE